MPYKDKRFDAFRRQRMESRKRGISFRFTFLDWVAWWEEHHGVDWLSKRGNKANHFVMDRKGDKGSYCRANVECITASQNATDNNHNNPHGNTIGSFLGRKHSAETKARMSRLHSGTG